MNTNRVDLIFKDEVYAIVGACMAVQNEPGSAFLEPVYQEALALEFEKRRILFKQEHRLEIFIRNKSLKKGTMQIFFATIKLS